MNAFELISDLRGCGLTFERQGDRLLVGPPALVTPVIAQTIRNHKADILASLEAGFTVTENLGSVVRIHGVPGWVAKRDLKPCGKCGGVRFFIGRWRLACVTCLKPKEREMILGEITLCTQGNPNG